MTGHPEAVLARELGLCYATIALVTDMDAGVNAEESVDVAQVFAMFAQNIDRLKNHLEVTIKALPDPGPCACNQWLDGVSLPFELP